MKVQRKCATRKSVLVRITQAALLRWIRDSECDARELAGCLDLESRDEAREIAALRAAVLRKLIKNMYATRRAPRPVPASVRVVFSTDR